MPKGTTSQVTRKASRQVVAGKTAAATGARTAIAPDEQDVARRAYEIYLEEGRPEGRHLDHWLRAIAELSN